MVSKLPDPLGTYFAAANARDPDGVAACFAVDGRVRDEGNDIRGRDAVRDWAEETGRKYRYRAEVTAVEAIANGALVTAHLTGDFPGNPVDLRYRFELRDGQIASLAIG